MNLVVDIFGNSRTFEPQPEPTMSQEHTDTTKLLPEFRIVSEAEQPLLIVREGPVSDPFTTVAHFYGRPVFAGDLEDHFKGLAIAELLALKMIKSGDDRGRFASGYGTKSPAGLWRSIVEAAASARPQLG